MDVSPPRYGCSCRRSFWNFARNMGYSQATSHGEMQWLRLYTQPIFISHQIYIYKRCLTTFICCGCAYGCVPTTLWLLMLTKLLECCQISGLLPGDKWWWNAVIEAAHSTHIISHQCYICIRCLTTFICCGCAYGRVPTMLWLLMQTYILECCQKSGLLPGDKWWWNAVLEAVHPTHIHLTSMFYI